MYTYTKFLSVADRKVQEFRMAIAAGRSPFYIQDQALGWVMAADRTDRAGLITTDEDGFRLSGAGDEQKDLPILSIWGDSIVQGADVSNEDSWAWQLQERLQGSYRVVNGGVSAYGTDQALIRFERNRECLRPQIAIMGYATTDLMRNTCVQRTFLHHAGEYLYLKPRFVICGGRLKLIEPPYILIEDIQRRFREHDVIQFHRAYDDHFPAIAPAMAQKFLDVLGLGSKVGPKVKKWWHAIEITKAIFDRFFDICRQSGIKGCALLLPVGQGANVSGRDFDLLVKHFRARGYPYLDPRARFPLSGPDRGQFYTKANHYTRHGGAVLVDSICASLADCGLT